MPCITAKYKVENIKITNNKTMKTFTANTEIILDDDHIIKPGDKICSTDEGWIMLPDQRIVIYPFDKFCEDHKAEGELFSDEFKLQKKTHLGDFTLKKESIIRRTADGMIELPGGSIVFYRYDSFCSEHKLDGVFVWLAKMRRAHCFLLTMYLKISNINFILSLTL